MMVGRWRRTVHRETFGPADAKSSSRRHATSCEPLRGTTVFARVHAEARRSTCPITRSGFRGPSCARQELPLQGVRKFLVGCGNRSAGIGVALAGTVPSTPGPLSGLSAAAASHGWGRGRSLRTGRQTPCNAVESPRAGDPATGHAPIRTVVVGDRGPCRLNRAVAANWATLKSSTLPKTPVTSSLLFRSHALGSKLVDGLRATCAEDVGGRSPSSRSSKSAGEHKREPSGAERSTLGFGDELVESCTDAPASAPVHTRKARVPKHIRVAQGAANDGQRR